ncbi:MAG: ribosome biogenesis GTPase Der [Sedimentisphaerales bacterium]|nr:ribosome biogenesis GTPase Der [Sedimentisphaerales bacterium]
MALPVVAIIGRPNVGKSSLFNWLAGRMLSIVEPTPGVTRDRVSAIIEKNGKYFELVDTGGFGIVDADHLESHVHQQIQTAIESANLILFMVDTREGLTTLDQTIAGLLRKHNLDILGVANKADDASRFPEAGVFGKLGFGDFLCVSVKSSVNKSLLLDTILDRLQNLEMTKPAEPVMKIAIVGKRNAGKSSLVNAIVGQTRVIVSETPGTTRDAIDIRFVKDGKTIVAIDTPGVRKKSKLAGNIEFYSFVRATSSVKRADVVLLMIDATTPVSQPDKRLAKLIADENKCCIIVVNKWDLAKDSAMTGQYEEYLTKVLPGLDYAPIAFTTATKAKNVKSVLDLAAELFKQANTWIPTPKLNKAFEIIKNQQPGTKKIGRPKIYYATQVAVNPVTILMFVNKPELFDEQYRRFIVGRLAEHLPIPETPIRLFVRNRPGERTKKPGKRRRKIFSKGVS